MVTYELDADLPATIKPAKILPASFTSKVTLDGREIPIIGVHSLFASGLYNGRFAVVATLVRMDHMPTPPWAGGPREHMWELYTSDPYAIRSPFHSQGYQGDSGSPCFLLINGEAVWCGSHMYSNAGDWIGPFKDEINGKLAALNAYGPTYTLTEADLSAFPNY